MTAFTDRTLWRATWQEFKLPWRWGWHLLPLIYLPITAIVLIWQSMRGFRVTETPLAISEVFQVILLGVSLGILLGRPAPTTRPRQRRVRMLAWIPLQVAMFAAATIACLHFQGMGKWGLGLFLVFHGLTRLILVTCDNRRVIAVGISIIVATSYLVYLASLRPDEFHDVLITGHVWSVTLIVVGCAFIILSWRLDGRHRAWDEISIFMWTYEQSRLIPKVSRLHGQRHFLSKWHDEQPDSPILDGSTSRVLWLARWRLLPLTWWRLFAVELAVLTTGSLIYLAIFSILTFSGYQMGWNDVFAAWIIGTLLLVVFLLYGIASIGWLAAATARIHRTIPFTGRRNSSFIFLLAGLIVSCRLTISGGLFLMVLVLTYSPHSLPNSLLLIPVLLISLFTVYCHALWLGTVSVWIRTLIVGASFGGIIPLLLWLSSNFARSFLLVFSLAMIAVLIFGIWLVHHRLSRWEP